MEKKVTAKEKLIETGMRLLTENRGEKFSSRMLAKEANVNHANINYHFGNRAGLNLAILETALERWNLCFAHIFEKTEKAVKEAEKENMAPVVREFIADILTALTSENSYRFLAVLFNSRLEQSDETFRQIFSNVLDPLYELTNEIASKSMGIDKKDPRCIIQGQLIIAQCMTFFRGKILFLEHKNIEIEKKFVTQDLIEIVSNSVLAGLGLIKQ